MGPYSSIGAGVNTIAGLIQSLLQGKKQTDPIANYEQDFGMTRGELGPRTGHHGYGQSYRPNPNYIPPGSSPSMNMDWSKVRASQRPGYVPDINPYDFTGIPGGGQKVAGELDLGLPEEFQTKLEEQALTGFPSIQSQDATSGEADAAADQAAISSQNTQGLGPNYGGRQWYDRDFATPAQNMGYDYTNEGLGSVGHDYTNEGYANWSTPQNAVSSGPTFAERDMLASAGENRDLLGIGQPVGLPPVDPREIAIKKRFGQNVGNLWGDVRLRERMQDLYGGSL